MQRKRTFLATRGSSSAVLQDPPTPSHTVGAVDELLPGWVSDCLPVRRRFVPAGTASAFPKERSCRAGIATPLFVPAGAGSPHGAFAGARDPNCLEECLGSCRRPHKRLRRAACCCRCTPCPELEGAGRSPFSWALEGAEAPEAGEGKARQSRTALNKLSTSSTSPLLGPNAFGEGLRGGRACSSSAGCSAKTRSRKMM